MLKKVKIAFLFNQVIDKDAFAGGEIRGYELVKRFSEIDNYEVHIIGIGSIADRFGDLQIIFHALPGNFLEDKFTHHYNNIYTFIIYLFRTVSCIKLMKNICMDVVYATGDFFCDVIPAYYYKNKFVDIKWITCVHHINRLPWKRKGVSVLKSFYSVITQHVSLMIIKKSCDRVTTINNIVVEHLKSIGVDNNRIVLVGNGLDTVFTLNLINKETDILPDERICYFGRVSPSKGVYDLPYILGYLKKYHPSIALHIVGSYDRNIRKKIENMFMEHDCLGNVTFHGFLENKADAYREILKSKVILNPSYEEGWSLALFETFLCRRPAVFYDLPEFRSILEGDTPHIPIGNKDKFAETVLELFENFGTESVNTYVEKYFDIAVKYDWGEVFKKERNIVDELVS